MPTTDLSGLLFRATTAHELKIKVLRDNRLQYLCVCGIKRKSRLGIMEHCAAKKLEGEERLSFESATGASSSRREVWPDDWDIAEDRPLNMVSNQNVTWNPAGYSIDPNTVTSTNTVAPHVSPSWREELDRLLGLEQERHRIQAEERHYQQPRVRGQIPYAQWVDEGSDPLADVQMWTDRYRAADHERY